jgi:hypothetical protein
MDNVLDAIVEKKINSLSNHIILLNYLGQLSTMLSAEQLIAKFNDEEYFLLHCIQVVTHTDINSMIHDKEELSFSIDQCRSFFSL